MNCARCGKVYPGGDPSKPGAALCGLCLLDVEPTEAEVQAAIATARRVDLAPLITRSVLRHASVTAGQRRRRGRRGRP